MKALAIAIPVPNPTVRDVVEELGATILAFVAYLVNGGVTKLLDWADGTASNTHTEYLEWGTSSTAPVKADTGNGTAGTEARVAATRVRATTGTPTNDTFSWTGTIAASGGSYPRTYKEVALFTAVTSGTCLIHASHTDVTVNAAGDNAAYTVTLQLTN